jgi:adenine-specific DNA-methyltransferase
VLANDWEPYALAINGAFIGLNAAPMSCNVFEKLNNLEPYEGFITKHYCPESDKNPDPDHERLFFTRANGMRIDAMRTCIAEWKDNGKINDEQMNYLLAPLLASASYVSNTSGVFKAYHHGWGGKTATALYRILSELKLTAPPLCDNGCKNIVLQMDAYQAAVQMKELTDSECDIVYLDPPYNQHPYGSNYHMLNTIALYDMPEVPPVQRGGKSAIRTDWRDSRRSAFNTTDAALPELEKIVDAIHSRWILISYSTDGNIPIESLVDSLARRGRLSIETHRYKRYRVSAQRMSLRSHNVEFVLILDTAAAPNPASAGDCLKMIEEEGDE